MLDFNPAGDCYHRSWNDWKYTCAHAPGHFEATCLQMAVVLNTNYNPYLQGANMFKKRELAADLRAIIGGPDAEWESLMSQMALDARQPPATDPEASHRALEALMFHHKTFERKGPFVRASAWWSIVAAFSHYDSTWTAWRLCLRAVAKRLMRQGDDLQAMQKEALQDLQQTQREEHEECGRAHHQEQLARVRKCKGQQLILGPILSHNLNFFNMRVMQLVGKWFWSEQTLWAREKATAEQYADFAVAYSTGLGERFLRTVWKGCVFSAEEWGRLGACPMPGMTHAEVGPTIDPVTGWTSPGVEAAQIPQRVAAFLLHMLEARFWAAAMHQHGLPGCFAGVLATDPTHHLQSLRELWDAITLAESMASECLGLHELRKQAYFLDWPVVQYGFRLLAHHHFQGTPPVLEWFRRQFVRLGDSKLIEDTNKIGRRLEQRHQEHKVSPSLTLYHALTRTAYTPLHWRNIPAVQLQSDQFYETPRASQPGRPARHPVLPWTDLFNPHATPDEERWHLHTILNTTANPFPSRSPKGQRAAVAALQALRLLSATGPASAAATEAWQTCGLCPGHAYCKDAAIEPEVASCFLVVAQATFAARVWPLQRIPAGARHGSEQHVSALWQVDPDRSWEWLVVTDISQWSCVARSWVLSSENAEEVGFLQMQPVEKDLGLEAPLPALADALLCKGHRRMPVAQVGKFGKQQKWAVPPGAGQEKALLQKVLADHPNREKLVSQWSPRPPPATRKRKHDDGGGEDDDEESAPDEEPSDAEMDWMNAAALDENPDTENLNFSRLAARARAKQDKLKAQSYMQEALAHNSPSEPGDIDETHGGTNFKCKFPWCKKFMPGHPDSMRRLPEGFEKQMQLHRDARGPNWIRAGRTNIRRSDHYSSLLEIIY